MKPNELADRMCGVVLAAITPFREDFSLDLEGMKGVVERSVADGLVNGKGALLIAGGGGELPFMTPEERAQVVAAAVQASAGRVPIIAGVQDDGTTRSIEVARQMQDVGADGLQLGPPCMYGHHPLEDIYRYYEAVCSAIEIGALAYNTWWTSAPFTPEFLLQLAEIDNVVGAKWSSPRNWEYLQGYRLAADKLVMIDNQGKTMEYGLIDIYRKNRLAQECEVHGIVTDWIADSSPTAAMTEYASELDLDKVKAAVEEIKDDRIRYVIEAHYFAGLSFENISIIMDCPRSTAHFLKDQGLKILRERFGG